MDIKTAKERLWKQIIEQKKKGQLLEVVGVGIGKAEIAVLVEKKIAELEKKVKALDSGGYRVETVVTGKIRSVYGKGGGICNQKIGRCGTVAIPVYRKSDDALMLLSCNHVLCMNTNRTTRSVKGDTIIDKGGKGIATLEAWEPIKVTCWMEGGVQKCDYFVKNYIDAAIAKPLNPAEITGIGEVSSTMAPNVGGIVTFHGSVSGENTGEILYTDLSYGITFEDEVYNLFDCFLIKVQSASGDSGGIITTRDGKTAVGMLLGATNEGYTIGCPINKVLNTLGLTLVTTENMAEKCESGSMHFSGTVTINGCTIKGIALETNHEPTHRINITLPWGEKKDFVGMTPGSCNFYYTDGHAILCKVCLDKVEGYTCYYTVCRTSEKCNQQFTVVDDDTGKYITGATVKVGGVKCEHEYPSLERYQKDNLTKGSWYNVVATKTGYTCPNNICKNTFEACGNAIVLKLKKEEVDYCYQYVRVETSDGKAVTYELTWGPGTWAMGTTPDTSMLYCEKGKGYTATATAEGYKSVSKTFTACTSQFTLTLTKGAPDVGSVNVSSTPTGAKIWVKPTGSTSYYYTGYTTTQTIGGLPVGLCDVKVTKEEYKDAIKTVTIYKDKTTDVSFTLKEEVAPAYAECGRAPTSSDSATYVTNWWKCAYPVAVKRGVCVTDWWDWPGEVGKDVKAELGTSAWYLQQRTSRDGDYIKIWMGVSTEGYLGRFKWKCPPVVADRFEVTVTEGVPTHGCCLLPFKDLFRMPFTDTHAITKVIGCSNKIAKKVGDAIVFTSADGLKVGEKYVINVGYEPPYPFDDPSLCGGYRLTAKTDEFVEFGGVKKINVKGFYDAPGWQKWWCGVFDVAEADCNSAWALAPPHILYAPRSWSCVLRGKELDGVTSCTPTKWDNLWVGLDCMVFIPVGRFAKFSGKGGHLAASVAKDTRVVRWIEVTITKKKLLRASAAMTDAQYDDCIKLLDAGMLDDATKYIDDILKVADEFEIAKKLGSQLDTIVHNSRKATRAETLRSAEIIARESKGLDALILSIKNATAGKDAAGIRKVLKAIYSTDNIGIIDRNLKGLPDDVKRVHNLYRYEHAGFVDTLKHTDAYIPEFANRFDEGVDFLIRDLVKKGEPGRYAKILGGFSETERIAIKTTLDRAGAVNCKSLISGIDTMRRLEKTGGVVSGVKAVGDDVVDVLKTGTPEAKTAAKSIVDDALDFINVIAKDEDAIRVIEKTDDAVRLPRAQRLWRYIKSLKDEAGRTWSEVTLAEKVKFYLKYIVLPGCFGLFITEETLQWVGFQAIPLSWATRDWEHKSLDRKKTAIANLKWWLEKRRDNHTAIGIMLVPLSVVCPWFAPLYLKFHEMDALGIEAYDRAIADLEKDLDPFTGNGLCYLKVYSDVDNVWIGVSGPTGEQATRGRPVERDVPTFDHSYSVALTGVKDGYLIATRTITINPRDLGETKKITLEMQLESNVYDQSPDTPKNPFGAMTPTADDLNMLKELPGAVGGSGDSKIFHRGEKHYGSIYCETEPLEGAAVFIIGGEWKNWHDTGIFTNDTLTSIPIGDYYIKFVKKGYKECPANEEKVIKVQIDQQTRAFCMIEEIKPTAAFDPSPLSPKAGELVTFDATDSKPGTTATITSYEWYCDDVKFGTDNIKATKTFSKGSYRIKLKVTNSFGHSKESLRVLTVAEAEVPVGNIKCYCEPAEYCSRNADIFVDGKKVDVTKSSGYAYIKDLTPGVHTVKYNLFDVMESSGSVTVTADKDAIYEGVLALSERIKSKFSYDPTNFYYKTVKVTKIEDGDSIFTDFTNPFPKPPLFQKGQQVRIAGYDSPDGATARENAKKKLTELIPVGSSVTLKIWPPAPLGKLNRFLAGVFKGDVDIAVEMLKSCLVNESAYKGKDNFPWVDWVDYGRLWKDPIGKECLIKPDLKPLITDIDTARKTFKINNRWFTLDFTVRFEDKYGEQKGVETKMHVDGRKVSTPIAYATGTYVIKLFACIEKCDKKENWILVDTGYVFVPTKKTVTFKSIPAGASVKVVKKETARLVRALKKVIRI